MRAGEWKVSCSAFRKKLDLDDGDFECWNNLARGYVMLKQKKRAFYAMREACKHEYENWKVWENFCVMSIDVGAFSEVRKPKNNNPFGTLLAPFLFLHATPCAPCDILYFVPTLVGC